MELIITGIKQVRAGLQARIQGMEAELDQVYEADEPDDNEIDRLEDRLEQLREAVESLDTALALI